jgi:hypothetical protein
MCVPALRARLRPREHQHQHQHIVHRPTARARSIRQDAAAGRCISRMPASRLAAWQFSARQCRVPWQCSHLRGVPQRRVAARLASVAGYAGPDESVLSFRRQNLSGASYKSAKPDHYRDSRLGLPRGDF